MVTYFDGLSPQDPITICIQSYGGVRMRLSEEEMKREIRKAKRFNTIAFVITIILTVAITLSLFLLRKKVADRNSVGYFFYLRYTFFIQRKVSFSP
jgi:hypothetical protein